MRFKQFIIQEGLWCSPGKGPQPKGRKPSDGIGGQANVESGNTAGGGGAAATPQSPMMMRKMKKS